METIFKAEVVDWVPNFDNTSAFNALSGYNQCNDERNARKTNNGFWHKITSFIKKKEVHPLVKFKEENSEEDVKTRNTMLMAWKQPFYVK